MRTTIYPARRVVTMNPSNPTATAVAVAEGRIVGVGTVDELAGWGEATVDDRFAAKVLLPGFVEAHAHTMEGALWRHAYVGWSDRIGPDGRRWPGCRTVEAVLDRLRGADAATAGAPGPLVAWGLDPIYFPGTRFSAAELDLVSTTRPIYVEHASSHLATVNSRLMADEGIHAGVTTPGVHRRPDGEPSGELQEPPAMNLAARARMALFAGLGTADAVTAFAYGARNVGVTTAADLAGLPLADPAAVASLEALTAGDGFPLRLVPFVANMPGNPAGADEAAELCVALRAQGHDKFFPGRRKLVLDGSIQGWTAQVSWPGYYTGAHHGQWLMVPEQVADHVAACHRRGVNVHAHCNGDLTSELFIDAVAAAFEAHPRLDHRHTVTHCQLTTPAQYRRMKALGMCANLFSNHLVTWGDQHRDQTVGPERARGMNAAATAKRLGVPFTLHSDAPVTPLGGLCLAWCAANRLTASGAVLGEPERISVHDALEAVTLGGAYVLHLDHLVGSLEAGKLADMVVLDDDPYAVDPAGLAAVGVWGTVVGGVPHEAPRG